MKSQSTHPKADKMAKISWIGFSFLVLVWMFVGIAGGVDLTRMERKTGPGVVQAVVDQVRDNCIFPQDRLFLRRLAFVVSQDGMDPKTYRSGYYGGIWQVDENMFRATQTCPANIVHLCNLISAKFAIDWRQVQWRDLLKPLYSGLAAALSIQRTQGETIPGDLAAQSLIWKNLYHPKPPIANFSSFVQTQNTCEAVIDLVFILDASGSIGYDNFRTMLNFLQRVVSELRVSRDGTHVSVVTFSNFPYVQFRLNEYYTESAINQQINRTYYSGGGTNTGDAIRKVTNEIFTTTSGARKDAAKVAVLLTDGASYDFIDTTSAAQKAKDDEGIVFFTIGIGSVNPLELTAVATDPNCTHYFLLNSFAEIDSMVYEIQKGACRAPLSFKLQNNVNKSISIVGNVRPSETNTTGTKPNRTDTVDFTKVVTIIFPKPTTLPRNNSADNDTFVSILTTVNCGAVYIYASYDITHPGPAFHDVTGVATSNLPSVIYVNTSIDGRPLYIAYNSQNLVGTAENCSYTSSVTQGPPKGAEVICRDENGERECSLIDFVTSKYNKFLCRNNWEDVRNPCTLDAISNNNLYHPHPYDDTKFIKCDLKGDMYITQCPGHKRYVPDSHVCGTENAIINNNYKPVAVNTITNPCTLRNIQDNKMFFPYPGDLTKFIHCNIDGVPWETSCPDGEIWFQDAQTCSQDYKHQEVTHLPLLFTNPCTQANFIAGKVFFLYPSDPNKYIHCEQMGVYHIQQCPPAMNFDLRLLTCIGRGQ